MNPDLAFLQAMLTNLTPEGLQKAIDSTAGFVGYNLEPEAALIIPFFAAFRARLPTDRNRTGAKKASWEAQLGFGSMSFATWGSAEKAIGTATTPVSTLFESPYLQQAFNGDVGFISMLMAMGFDDPMNIETSNVLAASAKMEEYICLLGNNVAISAPSGTGSPSSIQSPATFAAGTWNVKVTAITGQGAVANAAANSTTGESNSSASIAVVVPGGGATFLDIKIPAIAGAVGYKIYCETAAGNSTFRLVDPATQMRYRKITNSATDLSALGDVILVPTGQTFVTVNHIQVTAIPAGGNPAAPVADNSANALTFEGALSWAEKTTVYGQSTGSHSNVDADGAPFTTIGTGILEVDRILNNQWVSNNMSPSLIIGSANTINAMGNAVIKTSAVTPYRVDLTGKQGGFQGGIFMGGYTNKFAGTMLPGQNPIIPCWAHPYFPDGTLLLLSEDIPAASYKYSRKGKAFALDVLASYTFFELARTQLSIPFSIFWSQTLKCYHPTAQCVVQGLRVDQ